jgi:neutral trehalase
MVVGNKLKRVSNAFDKILLSDDGHKTFRLDVERERHGYYSGNRAVKLSGHAFSGRNDVVDELHLIKMEDKRN